MRTRHGKLIWAAFRWGWLLPASLAHAAGAPQEEESDAAYNASINIQVQDLEAASRAVRQKVRDAGGAVNAFNEQASGAWIQVHLPNDRVEALFGDLKALGHVTAQTSQGSDPRLLRAATRRKHFLEGSIERYARLESAASSERTKFRAERRIEALNTELASVEEPAANGVVNISLAAETESRAPASADSGVQVGARGAWLFLSRAHDHGSLWGAGSVVRWQIVDFELDAFRMSGAPHEGIDGLLLTVGLDFESDRTRGWTFAVPHLGFRAGYGSVLGSGGAAGAMSAGVFLVKHRWLRVDVNARAMGLVFGSGGPVGILAAAVALEVPF